LTIVKETKKNDKPLSLDKLTLCLSQTFVEIEEMKKEANLFSPSLYNLVLTNGKKMIATRYSTQPEKESRSLHIMSHAECYTCDKGYLKFRPSDAKDYSVLISSEVLSSNVEFWQKVPENHSITVDEDLHVQIRPMV
jgi:glutamine amidotransferase